MSAATLVDWAAWAASTTFSSTGLRLGYDKPDVDTFRSAVRETFLGGAVFWVGTPPVGSDDVRGKQFSAHLPGHDKTQVDAFLEAAGLRLAAMESTDRPEGPLVSGDILVRVGRLNDILKAQLAEAWLHGNGSGRLPGRIARHVPRGKETPGEIR